MENSEFRIQNSESENRGGRNASQNSTAETVISVRNVKKMFRVYRDRGNTLKDRILFAGRRKYEEHWVLNGVSFDVKRGEAIGLIGQNGCGKSTTLKMLTKILYPDEGTIEMKGRVSSLIELGAGFHPDLSGRENIYTNASIFGLSRKEIDARLEDIIAFSELEAFIDDPVRTYSSGMYMRLAFAVAINVDADILLIDEILAVGDAAFQAKCFNKLREIKGQGTTIVIVSHSLSQIEQICERSIWIMDGKIRMEGPPREVHAEYMAYMSEKVDRERGAAARKEEQKEKEEPKAAEPEPAAEETAEQESTPEAGEAAEEEPEEEDPQKPNGNRWGSREAEITSVEVLNGNGKAQTLFDPQEDITVRIRYRSKVALDDVVLGLALYRTDGVYIYGTNSLLDKTGVVKLEGTGTIDLNMRRVGLNQGEYSVDLALHRPDGFSYDFWRNTCTFTISERRSEVGIISLDHEWQIRKEKAK